MKTVPGEKGAWLIHDPSKCAGSRCVFHNPSEHHMRSWRIRVRASTLVERLCPEHGVGHPDPDSLAYFNSRGWRGFEVHGCCGCCSKGPKLEAVK
jgi:hypothetical protein